MCLLEVLLIFGPCRWQVWSAEREYLCKQAEIKAEKEASYLEAMKLNSLGGECMFACTRPCQTS